MKYRIYISIVAIFTSVSLYGQDTLRVIETDSTTEYIIQNYNSLDKYVNDTFFGVVDTANAGKFNFINFDKNHYQFYTEDSPNFEDLFFQIRQMVKNKDRKLNFYHIGGSHVQADIYTNDIREYIQGYWENLPGERGWVFPYNLAGTNNPWNYRFYSDNNWKGLRSSVRKDTAQYGLMGVAMYSIDSLISMDFKYRNTTNTPPINHVRIYHNKGELPYSIRFDETDFTVTKMMTNEEIGYTEAYFSKNTETFKVEFVRITDTLQIEDLSTAEEDFTILEEVPPTPLYIYGFQLLNDEPGITYNTIGVNGAGLYNYLDNVNYAEQLNVTPPDFFAFAVGTNDANVTYDKFKPEVYKSNLEKMMKMALEANPNCAIVLTVPNDAYYYRKYPNKNVARERNVIIELAEQYKIPVWDLYGIMGELGSSKTWRLNGLMKADYIHFTKDGYNLKGDMFFEAFIKWIDQMEQYQYETIIK